MTRLGRVLAVSALLLGVPVRAAALPGPTAAPEYWFAAWHVRQLWAAGARGQGVTIAEIDSGVTATLPELRGKVLVGRDFGRRGTGRVDRDVDPFGHGTAMASIMVARPGPLGITGLAPDARILPIAVPLDGTTEQAGAGRVPAAIRWAADRGADVVNLSIGGRSRDEGSRPCPAAEQRAVFDALAKGVVVIAAVGNTGPRRNTVEEPAACLGVLAVGAVNERGTVARFSSREPYIALDAPGVDVPSLGRIAGQAFSGNGTSQAAALTSAAAALVWSRYPRLTGTQVVARLMATLDKHRARADPAYGYGLLDAYRAVTAPVPPDTADPVAARAAPFRRRLAALRDPLGPAPAPRHSRGTATPVPTVPASAADPVDGHHPLGVVLAAAGSAALLLLLVAGLVRRITGSVGAFGRRGSAR